ncbi:hypothetical protein WJX82_000803 [Trebouxia sp. C0006]
MNTTCKPLPHLSLSAVKQYAYRHCHTGLTHKRLTSRHQILQRLLTKSQQSHERHMHEGEVVGTPQPMLKPSGRPAVSVVTILILLQAFAIVGAFVGGWLARQRRLELENTNRKLRHINTELRRRQTEDDDADAWSGIWQRRQISGLLRDGKASIRQGNGQHALELLRQAGQLSAELGDKRAERAVARATANAYREVGDLNMCLRSLDFSLGLSKEVGDTGRDSDVLGEIADVYTEMGDLDKAGQFYDRCIKAMAGDGLSSEGTASWEA